MTKLTKENIAYYVVNAPDDGDLHDTFAIKFENLKDVEKYRDMQENNFRERELLTENEFLAEWTKPAEAYGSEEEAAEDDCVWDDGYERWLEIPVDDWEK